MSWNMLQYTRGLPEFILLRVSKTQSCSDYTCYDWRFESFEMHSWKLGAWHDTSHATQPLCQRSQTPSAHPSCRFCRSLTAKSVHRFKVFMTFSTLVPRSVKRTLESLEFAETSSRAWLGSPNITCKKMTSVILMSHSLAVACVTAAPPGWLLPLL